MELEEKGLRGARGESRTGGCKRGCEGGREIDR